MFYLFIFIFFYKQSIHLMQFAMLQNDKVRWMRGVWVIALTGTCVIRVGCVYKRSVSWTCQVLVQTVDLKPWFSVALNHEHRHETGHAHAEQRPQTAEGSDGCSGSHQRKNNSFRALQDPCRAKRYLCFSQKKIWIHMLFVILDSSVLVYAQEQVKCISVKAGLKYIGLT